MLNSLRDEGHTLEPMSDEAGVEERCGTPHGWDAGRGRGVDEGVEWTRVQSGRGRGVDNGVEWTMAQSGQWCGVDNGTEWTMVWSGQWRGVDNGVDEDTAQGKMQLGYH